MSEIQLDIAFGGLSGFKMNEPIVLKAWITNIGTHTVKITDTHILREFDVRVMFENGQPVPMSAQGHQLNESVNGAASFRRVVIDLDPGSCHQLAAEIKLNEWFQLDRPDTYIVHIQRKDDGKDQPIISNLVVFIIK